MSPAKVTALRTGDRSPNRSTLSMPFLDTKLGHWLRLSLILTLFTSANAQEPDDPNKKEKGLQDRMIGEIDLVRVRELYHLTDTFGEMIWPGFNTRTIPIAINNNDRQELLINHPSPPDEFHPFHEFSLDGLQVVIQDGVTRFGPRGGGWAVDLGGCQTAYVSTLSERMDTESYLSLLLHECFHCFQKDYRQPATGASGDLPEDDARYSAMIGLESRILKAAIDDPSDERARELAQMFVCVRQARRAEMPKHLVLLEGEQEYNEGTATYSQARLFQLIAQNHGIQPLLNHKDPHYSGFPRAQQEYDRMVRMIIPVAGQPITFFHAMYQHGMAQCLVLDRVRPGWKKEMSEQGMTQFALLEKELPVDPERQPSILASAKERFDYQSILTEQNALIESRLDLIRNYIDAAGRRYQIFHREVPQRLKWKPFGPVYHVPESLEVELAAKRHEAGHEAKIGPQRRLVWAGGIRRFEKGRLVFESKDTPVIFGSEYLEWIDPSPAADDSDLHIESASQENGTHIDVKITTKGFTLQAAKARIDWSKNVVKIYPMNE